jgi:group II intron reverse transcriptase/maturase
MSADKTAKPYDIPKRDVWEAYKRVKANRGGAGVDSQSIADFEENLSKNLYKVWNRLSSGSYFPPAVRGVEIPKAKGGVRLLGIPTVGDRIAQMVVKRYLEPILDPQFREDSYGYRPGKSAKDALGVARQRCWQYDWVVDLDIKAFFDTIDHRLLMRAVRKHTTCAWVLRYIERWLKAPMQMSDGQVIERERGTPQGGVISPLLANLFLHYAFDLWMEREHREIPFERYADDVICHCRTEAKATQLRAELAQRFVDCGLELHPQKTKVVYCADSRRSEKHPVVQFDFLGYSFRPRFVKSSNGNFFVGFNPAISHEAAREIRKEMRGWRFYRRTDLEIEEIARRINPMLRGWCNYYGTYYRSALQNAIMQPLEEHLARWAMRKYRSLRGHRRRAREWIGKLLRSRPQLFAHRRFVLGMAG